MLLENVLRHEDGVGVTAADVEAVAGWVAPDEPSREISFKPGRVLLQDFTGVPAVVDLAAMRSAMDDLGGDPAKINPQLPVELVIDHSVQVDEFATRLAIVRNAELEFERNRERYAFLRWGQGAFDNFKVVPPSTGIVHQVNLEFLARVVDERDGVAFPDTLVGTDSHTTMINGLGVLGWGVGGIEAEAAMLGEAISMLVPQVVGFRLSGSLPEGATATDLVLTVTEILRATGVVGKFVEYFGHGLAGLPLADRATIGNMSPEYGATCGFFPVDEETLRYLRLTGRSSERIELVEAYCKENALWHDPDEPPTYSQIVELDLSTVEPSLAGPRRPQDRVPLREAKAAFVKALPTFGVDYGTAHDEALAESFPASDPPSQMEPGAEPFDGGAVVAVSEAPTGVADVGGATVTLDGETFELEHGSVVIAAITSCTNTSNPAVMVGAGLLAKNAVERGLTRKPWVKSSLAPGSKVVTEYYEKAGLTPYLEALGFHTVGYGCTTCIGNSGPLPEPISQGVADGDLVVCAVLSGNRNFEARIHPEVKANYLASPPLVVAYALAGRMDIDLATEPIGVGSDGEDVFLDDLWPSASGRTGDGCRRHRRGDVPHDLRGRVHGRRDLARASGSRGSPLRLGRVLDVRAPPAVLRRHATRARCRRGRHGRTLPRLDRRLRDHGPHLARGLDQAGLAGGATTSSRTASSGASSTRTARGAATTRSWCAAHSRTSASATCSFPAPRGPGPSTFPPATRRRSSRPRSGTAPRVSHSSYSPARSTARDRHATGRRKGRISWA